MSAVYNDNPPQIIANRYQVGSLLGKGGMASVYRGFDLSLQRQIAIKIMLPQFAIEAEFLERFKNEAQSAARLSCPQIVNVYDWGVDNSQCFIIMELVDGVDLRTLQEHQGFFSPVFVARVAQQVCKALDKAHRHGVIHNDIKPANIVLTRVGDVKLADFGIAQMGTASLAGQSVVGTKRYMSPERLRSERVTGTSDIYALGITMYELCGGSFNTSGTSAQSGPHQDTTEGLSDSGSASFGDVADDDFKRIVSTCIQRDPRARYSSAADLKAELTQYLTDHDTIDALELPVANAPEYWVLAPYEEQISPVSLIKIVKPCTIGRSAQADIRVPISTISDLHALVTPQDGFLFVQDLDSKNGTLVNGFSVGRDRVFCLPGDVLSLGPIQRKRSIFHAPQDWASALVSKRLIGH